MAQCFDTERKTPRIMTSSHPPKNSRLRIYIAFYGGMILLSAYLIGYNYHSQLKSAEETTLSKLQGVVSTLAQQVDRGEVARLYAQFPFTGDTAGLSSNGTYKMYCDLFERTKLSNDLKTPIYTLTYDSLSKHFYAGIASNELDSYGWHYKSPPQQLGDIYHSGGQISRFEDDHGTWLSAVQPLTDNDGNVFAVIEADYPFDSFISEARAVLLSEMAVSILVILIIGGLTYPILDRILKEEELAKAALEDANQAITKKNAEIVSSLEYARTIQETMLPQAEEMSSFLSECMVFNKPRDIVSGDFYWFHQLDKDCALLAVVDCTGHGVPGALMSIMGHSYLNELVVENGLRSPAEILERLNDKIKLTFGEKGKNKDGTDGMDVGICLIDKANGVIKFAGARRPLTIVGTNGVEHVKGTRRGIGEHYLSTQVPFEETLLKIDEGVSYYLCTDGLQDQFGGPESKKLMRKRVQRWFVDLHCITKCNRSSKLEELLSDWKKDNPQIDDICVLGFAP